jgi:hypothetical protein
MISLSGVVFVHHNILISIMRTHRLFEVNIQSQALRINGLDCIVKVDSSPADLPPGLMLPPRSLLIVNQFSPNKVQSMQKWFFSRNMYNIRQIVNYPMKKKKRNKRNTSPGARQENLWVNGKIASLIMNVLISRQSPSIWIN